MILLHGQNDGSRYTEVDKPDFRTIHYEEQAAILQDFNITEKTWKNLNK